VWFAANSIAKHFNPVSSLSPRASRYGVFFAHLHSKSYNRAADFAGTR